MAPTKINTSLSAIFGRAGYFDGDEPVEETEAADELAYEIPRAEDGALDFTGFDDDQLAALERTAVEVFNARNVEGVDAAGIEELSAIADDVEAIRGALTARAEEAAARAEQVADLAARVAPATDETEEADGDLTVDADEPASEDADETVEADGDLAATPAEPRVVRTRLRGPQLRQGGQVPDSALQVTNPVATLVASGADSMHQAVGDPSEFRPGDRASRQRLAKLIEGNFRNRADGQRSRQHIARLSAPMSEATTFNGDLSDLEKWDALMAPRNIDTLMDEGAMVASGCGPAETVYTHVNDTMLGTLVDVPERYFARGSMEFPETIDARDFVDQVAANGSWLDGDASKAEITFTCPTYRAPLVIEARYLRLQFTNMVRRSNPEFYTDVVDKVLLGHEIQKHLDTVLGIIAGGDNSAATPIVVDMTRNVADDADIYTDHAAGALLAQIEYLVEAARMRWMLGNSAALELLVPRWVRGAIRASVARKQADQDYNLADATIDGWFRARGVRPQFIDYWQHVPGDFSGREFPSDFEAVLYPANSVVRGTQGELDLGSEIRDSTLNADNLYELFREEFYAVGFMAHEPVVATLSTVPNGLTHATVAIAATAGDTVAPAHNARGNFDLA